MDGLSNDYTSSTPNSSFQVLEGNDVKKLSEEMDFKLNMAHRKRLAIKHFMSTTASSASKNSVPKTKKMAERNKTQILNDEHQHRLSRSLSFDSKDSILGVVDAHEDIKNKLVVRPYDPIKNYLSPRPKYLKFNPHRHREIFARQKHVTRVKRSASYDTGMIFHKEEVEPSVDCSSDVCSQKEEADLIDTEHEHKDEKEHGKEHEHEDEKEHENEHEDGKEHEQEDEEEKEEEIGDFQENGRWNLKVFLQYLMVIIVLILTTITITSIKSPNPSTAREAIQNFKNLYCKTYGSILRAVGFNFSEVGKLSKSEIDQLGQNEWGKKVGDHDMDSNQLVGFGSLETETVRSSKIDVNHDETLSKTDIGQFRNSQYNENEEAISYELHEPVILSRQEKIDFDRVEVGEEPKVRETVVDDIVKKDGDKIGFGEKIEAISLARFDPIFAAFIGVIVIILVSSIVVYYSKKLKIFSHVETTLAHQNSSNTKNLESFVNSSPLTNKTHSGSLIDSDADSSNQTKSSYFERSIDSPSYGSFIVEKKIVKKKKSKEVEEMLSPVRRSSRIHYRSVTSP